ncbi:hypothetical protein V8C42DRAFT_316791 [Trichoderma barbatum]
MMDDGERVWFVVVMGLSFRGLVNGVRLLGEDRANVLASPRFILSRSRNPVGSTEKSFEKPVTWWFLLCHFFIGSWYFKKTV